MSETDELNKSDDSFADSLFCATCPLPETITAYETGFELLQAQLEEIRQDLQHLVNRLDTFERAVSNPD